MPCLCSCVFARWQHACRGLRLPRGNCSRGKGNSIELESSDCFIGKLYCFELPLSFTPRRDNARISGLQRRLPSAFVGYSVALIGTGFIAQCTDGNLFGFLAIEDTPVVNVEVPPKIFRRFGWRELRG
jgi:hypothetical protein